MTFEGTRSTNTITPCPPTYSPASQRSRYSQPNLPTLTVPYNERSRHNYHNRHHSHNNRSTVDSPDRRTRMSQPTLNSSFFGINFVGGLKGNSKLSFSSLHASGYDSINSQVQQVRLSTPNVHAFGNNIQDCNSTQIIDGDYQRNSMFLQSGIRRINRTNYSGTRERLSQPTLMTGDYYPQRIQHQRLSQPCLLSTWNETPLCLQSPMKQKRFGSTKPNISQRDRISQLDFGGAAKFRYNRETVSPSKFNRDRFSIPELETQNDLRLIVGPPKQRYSLDSQLNPDGSRTRRLLPIASSPISEHQSGITSKHDSNKEVGSFIPSERLKKIIIATATPIIPADKRKLLVPMMKKTPPTLPLSPRERMSVPEIRNASLRRLLDPPIKQRHSIVGNLRQTSCYLGKGGVLSDDLKEKSPETLIHVTKKTLKIDKNEKHSEIDINIEPKHIQRHYSYTYDNKDETNEVIGKLGIALPKKKYLESNFDENEQVITTVIETEVPIILGSPKYNKKTHVYASSEPPKWMKKCLETNNLGKKSLHDSQMLKSNHMNLLKISAIENLNNITVEREKISSTKTTDKTFQLMEITKNIVCTSSNTDDDCKVKNTCVRMKSSLSAGENNYEVTINSD